jgi:phosphatidylglycerophosphate synthase
MRSARLTAQHQPRLERWSHSNAALLLSALGVGLALGRPWPLALVACGSFAALVREGRGAWTANAGFGWANRLTSLRLLLVVLLSLLLHGGDGRVLCAVALLTLTLDAVDGWLARRLGLMSEFGAHFDMEVDALFVLSTGAELYLSGKLGAWILLGGVLRYLYVLSVALWPAPAEQMPRSRLGRTAFAGLVTGHALAFVLPGRAALVAGALGTGAVALSFARSFRHAYTEPRQPIADTPLMNSREASSNERAGRGRLRASATARARSE